MKVGWAEGMRLEAFANLAHELRTPLQVMLGYLDVLRDEWAPGLGDEPRRILERMNTNAHELAHTVENLVEFAAVEAGAEPSVDDEFTISDLIAELLPTFEAANKSKVLLLRFDLAGAETPLRSRRRALRLILQNLVLNAIKFTETGSVTVTARRLEKGVELEVHDTGPGLSAEQIEMACEPLVQLSRSSKRRYRGMGLGLAVVRHHVAALGGILAACSEPGAGATFAVTIPLRPVEKAVEEPIVSAPAAGPRFSDNGASGRPRRRATAPRSRRRKSAAWSYSPVAAGSCLPARDSTS
jgi:signal transduction histidine kinase